jgi:hypothetical protein
MPLALCPACHGGRGACAPAFADAANRAAQTYRQLRDVGRQMRQAELGMEETVPANVWALRQVAPAGAPPPLPPAVAAILTRFDPDRARRARLGEPAARSLTVRAPADASPVVSGPSRARALRLPDPRGRAVYRSYIHCVIFPLNSPGGQLSCDDHGLARAFARVLCL